jgi:hypothetical protein
MSVTGDWITLAEAVDLLAASGVHVTADTVGDWARAGRLVTIKLAGRRYVRRHDVRALVALPKPTKPGDAAPGPGLFDDLV